MNVPTVVHTLLCCALSCAHLIHVCILLLFFRHSYFIFIRKVDSAPQLFVVSLIPPLPSLVLFIGFAAPFMFAGTDWYKG